MTSTSANIPVAAAAASLPMENADATITDSSSVSSGSNGINYPYPPTVGGAVAGQSAAIPYAATTSASIYVGELHTDVTESLLFELFNQVGPVASIRVCRDAVTRRSLGYAYVNFHNVVDAERALDTLNYAPIKGKPCRLMWSQRDPSLRRSGSGNIFIKNLDKSIDNKALHDTFSAFGNILSCKVVCDENGSKGYGYVHYETQEAADLAIAKVNGMLLNDKKVFVGHHVSRKERVSKAEELKAQFTNIYVKSIDLSVNDDEFRELFAPFGEITSCALQLDENGGSKGFGFVNYANHESAQQAVDEMNNKEVKSQPIVVCRAQSKAEREDELRRQFEQLKLERIGKYQGVNLYVKNLDETLEDEKLKEEFASFGNITSAKIMRDERGNSRGFGFVCFSSTEEATKAVTEMNGRLICGKPIYVALAQRKDERRSQLENQYAQRAQLRMQTGMPGMPMYPGAPMFYGPGVVPGQRPGFMYPPQMMARPRWTPQPGVQASRPGMGFSPVSGYGMMAPIPGMRPVRAPRPMRGGMGGGMSRGGSSIRGYRYPPSGVRNGRPEYSYGGGLTLNALANASPAQQKQILGERLYPLVHRHEPELASKITGMLLEMDNGEVLHLLESPDALASKVGEAVAVLQHHIGQSEHGANGAEATA